MPFTLRLVSSVEDKLDELNEGIPLEYMSTKTSKIHYLIMSFDKNLNELKSVKSELSELKKYVRELTSLLVEKERIEVRKQNVEVDIIHLIERNPVK